MAGRGRTGRKRRGKKKTNLLLKTYIGSLDLYTGFFLYQEVLDLKNKYGFISLKTDLNLRHIKRPSKNQTYFYSNIFKYSFFPK